MQALIFLDIGTKSLGSNATGASFSWPKIPAGDDMRLKHRLIETVAGEKITSRREISAMKLSVGNQDRRPTSGAVQLKLVAGAESVGANTTDAIGYDSTAEDFATALNALTDATLTAKKPFTVTKRDGSWHVRAANDSTVPFTIADNSLLPQSLVSIRDYTFDEATHYEIRFIQTVLAEQTNFAAIVPELPSVSVVQVGATESGVKRNTIQQIYFPPELSGGYSFRLKWALRRTTAIILPTDEAAIQSALDAILEDGEEVTVSAGTDRVLIEFAGDTLAGTSVAALEIESIVPPAADSVINLSTATDAMAKYMATIANAATGITEFKLPLALTLWLVDEQDEEETEEITFIWEITFQKPVSMAAFSAAATLNPTKPLSRTSYLPFSPTQVTETQRGYLLTGATALGDGAATEFQVDHNLGTRHVYVSLFDSAVDGQMLKHGTDYEVEIVSDNAVKIIFPSAPATDSVVGGICTVASTNAFVDLEIEIGQVIGLEDRLVALEEAVDVLQTLAPSGSISSSSNVSSGPSLSVPLPSFVEAYPALNPDLNAAGTLKVASLGEIPSASLPSNGGLVPAVHDVAVETLATTPPTPADSYKGRVFRNASLTTAIELDGGYGRKNVSIRPGEFAACDGKTWYPVKRYDSSATVTPKVFTAATDDVITSAGHGWNDGQAVLVDSADTLPAPLAREVQYFVRDKTTDTFKLAATAGGAAIDITTTGTGTHTVVAAPKSTFYPADMERELFVLPIKAKQFRIKQTLELFAGIETAIANVKVAHPRTTDWRYRDQLTKAQWTLVMRWGTATSETTPGTPAANLKTITWNTTPILEQRIDLVPSPIVHTFGCRIKRTAESTFTVEEILYGLATGSLATINTADLYLGAWLERFDTEDSVSDSRGLALLMGLSRTNSTAAEANLGKLVIK